MPTGEQEGKGEVWVCSWEGVLPDFLTQEVYTDTSYLRKEDRMEMDTQQSV